MRNKQLAFVGVIIALFAFATKVEAQTDLQLHYNFGKHIYESRKADNPVFLTMEHFSSDKYGDTFFFTDLTFAKNELGQAYFEVFRNLRFWDAPFSIHMEYNGGLDKHFWMPHVYIGGVSYSYVKPADQLALGLMVGYRHDQKQPRPHNFHTTGTWSWTSWNRLWTLSGFVDFWSVSNDWSKGRIAFLSEPQLWLNLNQFVGIHDDFNLSIGTEVKLSYNFVEADKFFVMPTLGLKWTFK